MAKSNLFRTIFALLLLACIAGCDVLPFWKTEDPETDLVEARSKKLVIASWGGALEDAMKIVYAPPFYKETGIEVEFIDLAQTEDTFESVAASDDVKWDIYVIPDRSIPGAVREGQLEPLDWGFIGKDNIYPEAVHAYAAGAYSYVTAMTYNADIFGENHPKDWVDFWDVETFPGARSLRKKPVDNLEWALLVDGVPADQLYPLDLDRAFRSLDRIKPYISVWWTGGAQSVQIMVDGETVLGSAWHGRVAPRQAEGAPLEWNWEQSVMHLDFWAVIRGAPNKKGAMRFIKFALDPQRQADFAREIPYSPTNREAYNYIDEALAATLPSHPQIREQTISIDLGWWGENLDAATNRFNDWVEGD